MTSNEDVTCDTKRYMKTDTEYNSCVYDLEADLDDLPSNIILPETDDLNKILRNTLPYSKKAYLKLTTDRTVPVGFISLSSSFQVYTEKVKVNIPITCFVNNYNCNITESCITGTLKDNSSIETSLLSIKDYSKIKYNGSSLLTVELYDEFGNIVDSTHTPKKDLLQSFQLDKLTTSKGYFKFRFRTNEYLESLQCYIKDKELITKVNNKIKSKTIKPTLTTNYTILVNGNHIKTHKNGEDKRKTGKEYNTSYCTSFQIIVDNQILKTKNRSK